MQTTWGIIVIVKADKTATGIVALTMTYAEVVALREAISFADFDGGLPQRDPAEVTIVSRLLRALDPLIPELGTDDYVAAVSAAWRDISTGG